MKRYKDKDDVQYVQELRNQWDSLMSDQIEKSLALRDYIYNTDSEEAAISPKGDLQNNIQKVTMSALRPALNRIKTDVRDLEASISVYPKKPQKNDEITKIFSEILNESLLNKENHSELYNAFDNILDLSYCVVRMRTESSFDEYSRRIVTSLNMENVPDVTDVFFDASVPLESINKEGSYVGYHKIIDSDHPIKKNEEIYELWEKVYKDVKYGVRRSINDPDEYIAEVAKNGVKYLRKYIIKEVDHIRHKVWKKKELVHSEKWPFKSLPYIIGFGVHVDNYSGPVKGINNYMGNRVSLAPFAEHTQKAQMVLDYAASLQLHNIKMSRGTTKFMFEQTMLDSEQLKQWKQRNTEDVDLTYTAPLDNSGNPIAGWKPEPVPDVPLSATITEAITNIPIMINSLLGVNLEQDITYNASGEAIRQMQMVRHKNAKLYTDRFLELLDDIGAVLDSYIPIIYAGKQYVTINNNGRYETILINSEDSLDHPPIMISEIVKSHKIEMGAGKNRVSSDEQTRIALEQLYRMTASVPGLGQNVVSSTLDIYADSLDSPSSADISKRISLFIPQDVRDLSEGKVTVDQIHQKQEIQQQQQAVQMQQMQEMQQKAEGAKVQADVMDSQAKMVKARADMVDANSKISESQNKLRGTELKTNAEIAKSFRNDD